MTDPSDDLIAALRAALGGAAVLSGDDIPARNESDWSTLAPQRPLAVVRPDTPEGVATTLRLAGASGVAVVPQGGLTGLAGGARPVAGAIALSLERLSGVEEIDVAAGTMTVRAGTTLEAVQTAVRGVGLFFALDLGARGSCTIGGNLSTNAGGNRVLRYGMARDLTLGLEVALADGTLLTSLNKMQKNNAGYDLKQLFIGSEGTLGVITRAVLRLHPAPSQVAAALCGLASYTKVIALLAHARSRLGPLLSAFEVMWPDYWDVATQRVAGVRSPLTGRHGIYVLIEMHGFDDTAPAQFQAWLEAEYEAGVVEDAGFAQSLADVTAFWGVRDAPAEFGRVLGPHGAFDIGLPVGAMDAFVHDCKSSLLREWPSSESLYYGHIADGNLHLVASVRGLSEQPFGRIDEIVYDAVRRHGGTISAEHGVGIIKKPYLGYTRTAQEISLMKTVKRALDPENRLNPGKVL